MRDAIGSKSIIRNFMGNAGRNVCNDYLYDALQDADTKTDDQCEVYDVISKCK